MPQNHDRGGHEQGDPNAPRHEGGPKDGRAKSHGGGKGGGGGRGPGSGLGASGSKGSGGGRGHGGGKGSGGGRGHGKGRRGRRRERVRDEDGQFVEAADEDDVLGVFGAVDGPVVTTTDVSELLGITTEAARQKLNDLVTDGELRRRKTGRTVVYWQVDPTEGDGK